MIVGVLGGGQLGRMMALAGYPLGLRFRFFDPDPEAPAGQLAELHIGAFDDPQALRRFAADVAVVTYEFENIPAFPVRELAKTLPVWPPPDALETAQDRLAEKGLFRALDIPTAPFVAVGSRADLETAGRHLPFPLVLKTRRLGYDGKGQWVLRTAADSERVAAMVDKTPMIVERFVCFERELSCIAVRGMDGATAFYPLIENHHQGGILRQSLAPAPECPDGLQRQAEEYVGRILDALDYVGVLTVEFFLDNGQLIANEMAPRVHNSGHWTIEGAETSQFENHLRAILGWPLGSTAARGYAAMINLIGALPDLPTLLAVPGVHAHHYGKAARPGRKLGHVTLCSSQWQALREKVENIATRIVFPSVR
ncbi:MAG: 5-(carboxyamino)imidazole ribonucleotide synthase [Gemmataceae bacterium]